MDMTKQQQFDLLRLRMQKLSYVLLEMSQNMKIEELEDYLSEDIPDFVEIVWDNSPNSYESVSIGIAQ